MTLDAAKIDSLLPQTQCTRCGYPDCRKYAEAIAAGRADINQCAPGGDDTVGAIAKLLARAPKPLNPAYGRHKPAETAVIDEPACIGCMLCIRACPVDAIVGAPGRMHTVLTAHCTGCELCVPACPVDCISMHALTTLAGRGDEAASTMLAKTPVQAAADARARFAFHRERLQRDRLEKEQRLARKSPATAGAATPQAPASDGDRRQAAIAAALARARARRAREEVARKDKP